MHGSDKVLSLETSRLLYEMKEKQVFLSRYNQSIGSVQTKLISKQSCASKACVALCVCEARLFYRRPAERLKGSKLTEEQYLGPPEYHTAQSN
jgi:hypothetical protein